MGNTNTLKSIGAVLAGMGVIIVLSVATDVALELCDVFPRPGQGYFKTWMLVVALVYRCMYAVAGGYLTATLASANGMRHVWVLAAIGLALSIAGAMIGWSLPDRWYPIALVITSLPCTLLGGRLKTEIKLKQ